MGVPRSELERLAYLLTSESRVLAADAAGDVTITRVPENDFKCPIQPLK